MEHPLQRPERGKWSAAFFSLLMHGLLLGVLYYGVQWQHRAPAGGVSVELVRSLPAVAPQAEPERAVEPTPPKPVVEEKPAEVKPPLVKPDIAVKEPEKKKPEKKKEEPKPAPVEPPKPEKKPEKKEEPKPAQSKPEKKPEKKPDEQKPPLPNMDRLLAKEADKASAAKNQAQRDQDKKALNSKLDATLGSLHAGGSTTAGAATGAAGAGSPGAGGVGNGGWSGLIAQKVKSNLMRPQGVSGNPVVEFKIELLPSGEVLGEPKLVKSSGNGALDEAARRAILKSSPLPKPPKNEEFQREITLKFHPMADGE